MVDPNSAPNILNVKELEKSGQPDRNVVVMVSLTKMAIVLKIARASITAHIRRWSKRMQTWRNPHPHLHPLRLLVSFTDQFTSVVHLKFKQNCEEEKMPGKWFCLISEAEKNIKNLFLRDLSCRIFEYLLYQNERFKIKCLLIECTNIFWRFNTSLLFT